MSERAEWLREVASLVAKLAKAQEASDRAQARSMAVRPGAGGTRARGTTARANWAKHAELRDRIDEHLASLGVVIPYSRPEAADDGGES